MQIIVCSHAPFVPEVGTPYHLTVALGRLTPTVFITPVLSFRQRRAVRAAANQTPVQVIAPVLPGGGRSAPRRWRRRWLARWIAHTVRRQLPPLLKPPVVLWAHCTETALWLDELIQPKLFCYHRLDDFSAMDERNAPLERQLMQRADLNFVVASQLITPELMRPHSWVYLPNGVNAELFALAREKATQVPQDLESIPSPRIGYIGAIHPDWVDVELVLELARAAPQWSWVIIGPKIRWEPPSDTPPNLHWMGARPYLSLPAYLKGLDVCIIPFRCNAIAQGASPLKLYEYLAAGKAVVSAPCFEDLNQFGQLVYTASTPTEWLHALRSALDEAACPTQISRRVESIASHTWQARAQCVIEILQQALKLRLTS